MVELGRGRIESSTSQIRVTTRKEGTYILFPYTKRAESFGRTSVKVLLLSLSLMYTFPSDFRVSLKDIENNLNLPDYTGPDKLDPLFT